MVLTEPERGARAHPNAPQLHVAAEFGEDGAHQVVLAHADAGRGDEEVRVPGAGEMVAQALLRVASDAQVERHAAGPADHAEQGVGVRGRDLGAGEDLGRVVQVHDLVS